jgi:hypothetical protein
MLAGSNRDVQGRSAALAVIIHTLAILTSECSWQTLYCIFNTMQCVTFRAMLLAKCCCHIQQLSCCCRDSNVGLWPSHQLLSHFFSFELCLAPVGIKAWAEVVSKVGRLLHATEAELEEMSEADRQMAMDARAQRFIPMPCDIGKVLPRVLTSSFYNRPVYDDFLDLIDKLDAGGHCYWALVVTGDPGIGKSTLALRLILKLAAQRKKFIFK